MHGLHSSPFCSACAALLSSKENPKKTPTSTTSELPSKAARVQGVQKFAMELSNQAGAASEASEAARTDPLAAQRDLSYLSLSQKVSTVERDRGDSGPRSHRDGSPTIEGPRGGMRSARNSGMQSRRKMPDYQRARDQWESQAAGTNGVTPENQARSRYRLDMGTRAAAARLVVRERAAKERAQRRAQREAAKAKAVEERDYVPESRENVNLTRRISNASMNTPGGQSAASAASAASPPWSPFLQQAKVQSQRWPQQPAAAASEANWFVRCFGRGEEVEGSPGHQMHSPGAWHRSPDGMWERAQTQLPPYWVEVPDEKSGEIYYWNHATGETSWLRPSSDGPADYMVTAALAAASSPLQPTGAPSAATKDAAARGELTAEEDAALRRVQALARGHATRKAEAAENAALSRAERNDVFLDIGRWLLCLPNYEPTAAETRSIDSNSPTHTYAIGDAETADDEVASYTTPETAPPLKQQPGQVRQSQPAPPHLQQWASRATGSAYGSAYGMLEGARGATYEGARGTTLGSAGGVQKQGQTGTASAAAPLAAALSSMGSNASGVAKAPEKPIMVSRKSERFSTWPPPKEEVLKLEEDQAKAAVAAEKAAADREAAEESRRSSAAKAREDQLAAEKRASEEAAAKAKAEAMAEAAAKAERERKAMEVIQLAAMDKVSNERARAKDAEDKANAKRVAAQQAAVESARAVQRAAAARRPRMQAKTS